MKLNEVKKIADPSKDEADRLLDLAERQLDVFMDYSVVTNDRIARKKIQEIGSLIIRAREQLQK